MSVRSLSCPKCQTKINVPAAMQTARCPACGSVFSIGSANAANQGSAANDASPENTTASHAAGSGEETTDNKSNDPTMIYVAVGGVMALLVILGVVGVMLMSPSNSELKKPVSENTEPVFREATAEEIASLNIVNIPEERRRRIYDDMRKTATMTTEKPLMVPTSGVRDKLEGMLDATYENSIQQLAALHDLRKDDIRDIVKEGDMKNWDTHARSRAYRGGERIYEDEQTQGFEAKSPI